MPFLMSLQITFIARKGKQSSQNKNENAGRGDGKGARGK